MPASDRASATRSDISGSSELITRDRVTTVTPKPRRSAASATSMPTYPAPTITTCAPGSAASNRSSHAAPSSSVCTAPTRSYGVPSAWSAHAGTIGYAPLATTSWSNSTVSPAVVVT